MSIETLVKDTRPKRIAWAPGDYECACYRCKRHFLGDKRALMCADCAYALPLLSEMDIEEIRHSMLNMFDTFKLYVSKLDKTTFF